VTARPYVYVNMAMTADGKITSAAREFPEFTSDEDRRTMDRLRAEADVLVVGAGTLRADDPPMYIRDPEMLELRRALGKPAELPVVVVSASLRLDLNARWFRRGERAHRIVATVEDGDPERLARLRTVAEVVPCGLGRVDVTALVARLAARGFARVLVEGGGELNWEFVRAGLVDAVHVTVTPVLLGGRDAPTFLEGNGFAMDERRHLRLADVRRVGDELFLRWQIVR